MSSGVRGKLKELGREYDRREGVRQALPPWHVEQRAGYARNKPGPRHAIPVSMTDIEQLKADIAILSDDKINKDDVTSIRRMASTVPALLMALMSLVLSALALVGVQLDDTSAPVDSSAEEGEETEKKLDL